MFETPLQQIDTDPDQSSVKLQWFAVYTASHHEKHVFEQFSARQIESFLPLYTETRHWQKRKAVELSLPLFPNYVFVRIAAGRRVHVLGIPGVFSIVGSSQGQWDLPDWEIQALRDGLKQRKVRPHTRLEVGERARVKSGLLAGLEGVIIREKNLRMVLSLHRIARSIAIEVDEEELESIPPKTDSFWNGSIIVPSPANLRRIHQSDPSDRGEREIRRQNVTSSRHGAIVTCV
jgi:transcription antitermination factor NusG